MFKFYRKKEDNCIPPTPSLPCNFGLRHHYILKVAAVLEYIAQAGDGKLDGDHPLESGVLDSRCGRGCIPFMEVCSRAKVGLGKGSKNKLIIFAEFSANGGGGTPHP